MKRILFIATTNLNERSGGSLAALAYYNAFQNKFNKIVDLALPEEFCIGIYKNAIPVPRRNKIIAYIDLFKGRLHRYKDFFNKFLTINANNYDLAVINGGINAGDMIDMFQSYGLKVIVIHHNYEPEYQMDNKTNRTIWGLTPYFVAKNERNAYKQADLNAYLTKSDIKLHQTHYGKSKTEPYLLGTFEPQKEEIIWRNEPKRLESHKNIIITGSMDSVQTVRGILDFKENYFPIFRKLLPDWKIIIAGRNPDSRILDFVNKNPDCISIIPNPQNINDVIAMGNIFLCPTNVGGGLKLRLMDGLRNGLLILTHEVSARGYEVFHNQPFFQIYKDKKTFAQSLSLLTAFYNSNEEYYSKICSIYHSYFSFEAGCKRVNEMISLLK